MVDVLLVSLGSTPGLRASDAELAAAWRRAGATVDVVAARRPRDVRTFALTDLLWARAARQAAREALRRARPRALVFSSVGAALLWPEPGAVRFDAPMAHNRPGRHGIWQRPVERRRLRAAPLLLPLSPEALAAAPQPHAPAVVVPVPVEPPAGPAPARDLTAVTYAANPHKKGLDRVLAAWRAAARPGERLIVAGASGPPADGVAYEPLLPHAAYRSLLRRARVFLTAPRREDHGLAQLEALAHGCALVTTPSAGPYAALRIARALDPRWVAAPSELGAALRAALDDPPAEYGAHALALLEPHLRPATDAAAATALERLLG